VGMPWDADHAPMQLDRRTWLDRSPARGCLETNVNKSRIGQSPGPFAAQRPRYALRAAVRLALKMSRLERFRPLNQVFSDNIGDTSALG